MTLIEEIDAYLARNKISQSAFTMHVLFNTNAYTYLYQGKLGEKPQARLRQFMADYPDADGIPKTRIKSSLEERIKRRHRRTQEANKSHSRNVPRVQERIDISSAQIVSRDPCTTCGARGDYPCGHQTSNHWASIAQSGLHKMRIAG